MGRNGSSMMRWEMATEVPQRKKRRSRAAVALRSVLALALCAALVPVQAFAAIGAMPFAPTPEEVEAALANEVYALYYRNGKTDTYTLVLQKGSTPEPNRGELVETQTGFVCNDKLPTKNCVCRAVSSSLNAKVTSVIVRDAMAPHSTAYWFAGMKTCTSLDLAKLDMSQVTDMSGMFSGCESMAVLDLSSFNLAKVQAMGDLFPKRSSVLTTIKVPATGDFSNILPTPSPSFLAGATGKWVNGQGKVLSSAIVPARTAATYVAQRGYSVANGFIDQDIFDYVYTGKAITPQFPVRVAGLTLKPGVDYAVSYKKNKAIGKATMVVQGKGAYSGMLTCTFRINPQNVKRVAVKKGRKSVTVKWAKRKDQARLISGYEVRVSADKAAHKVKALRIVKKPKASSVTIKGLKAKKTYYVSLRTYKKIGNRYYFSTWSKPKAVKTK